MKGGHSLRSAAVGVLFLVATSASGSFASTLQPKVIVVVHTYGADTPARYAFDTAFARTLREASDVATELYIETLDSNRFRGEEQRKLTSAYLREKYAGKPIAVAVAVYGLALDFLLDPRDPPFPGVPIAATLSRYPERVPPGVAFTWSGSAMRDTLALALTLQPGAEHIAVIDGGPVRTERDTLFREIQLQVDSVKQGKPVTYLRDLPLDQLLPRLRALPPNTVVLMARQLLGRNGAVITNVDAIEEVAAAAPAPVYVTSDQQLGSGAVGGKLLNFDLVGSQLAGLALRVAESGSPDIPPEEDRLVPTFDWRQLRRWQIDESLLPAGSVVLHRESSLWDQYRSYIIIAIIVVGVQTALIAGLVVQGNRRRRTERALRDSEQHLRQSYDQNRDLAGRLIKAQEAERAHLARELHDDVSQQLAGLSIMMSGLKHRIGKPVAPAEIESTVASLQGRTATLAQAIRGLSHQLHPGVLQHAGLAAALNRHCTEVGSTHAIEVAFTAAGDVDALTPDATLCLYRVAQEALTNAVRHAHARSVRVGVIAVNGMVELTVADDGVGFDAGHRTSSGLGLRSIDERVRLVRGEATVASRPGQGTTVSVRVPANAT